MASPAVHSAGRLVFLLTAVLLLGCTRAAGPLSYLEGLDHVALLASLPVHHRERLLREHAGASKQLLSLIPGADLGQLILNSAPQISDTTNGERVDAYRQRVLGSRQSAAILASVEQCLNDTTLLEQAFLSREPWAMRMVDAFGKPSPAILDFNLIWLGAYDECRDVTVPPNMTSDGHGFSGQYCNAYIPLNLSSGLPQAATVQEGICVPDSCSNRDIRLIVNTQLALMNSSLSLADVSCAEQQRALDTKAIAALAVCGLFALLLVLGTLVDVVLVQMPRMRGEEMLRMMETGVDSRGEREPLLDSQKQSYTVELGTCSKLLASFSVYTNVKTLLNTQQPPGSLTCVHGIRLLSMTWVLLGHCFFVIEMMGSWNVVPWMQTALKRFSFQLIANATVSVDTFFVLGGLLVSYLSLREMQKKKGFLGFSWLLFFFHRFWRLTPAYMLLVFFYLALMPYWGHGPLWPHAWPDRDNCNRNWWTNLLYINNFVRTEEACLGHSWYLANDMQFYLLSPFIFVPLYYSAKLGTLCALLFLLAATVTPAVLTFVDKLPPGMLARVDVSEVNYTKWMSDFYIKPYVRMAPYIVGLLAGYILYRTNGRLRMHKCVALVGWIVAAALAMASVFGLYDATANEPMPLWLSAVYNAAGRTAWALGVAWVVVACVSGNGGFVNTLLSWSALVPLSRLTYCAYLIHLPLMYTIFLLRRTAFFVTDIEAVMFFLGVLMLSYLLAVVTSLAFECPARGMEKVLLHRDKSTQRSTR